MTSSRATLPPPFFFAMAVFLAAAALAPLAMLMADS